MHPFSVQYLDLAVQNNVLKPSCGCDIDFLELSFNSVISDFYLGENMRVVGTWHLITLCTVFVRDVGLTFIDSPMISRQSSNPHSFHYCFKDFGTKINWILRWLAFKTSKVVLCFLMQCDMCIWGVYIIKKPTHHEILWIFLAQLEAWVNGVMNKCVIPYESWQGIAKLATLQVSTFVYNHHQD